MKRSTFRSPVRKIYKTGEKVQVRYPTRVRRGIIVEPNTTTYLTDECIVRTKKGITIRRLSQIRPLDGRNAKKDEPIKNRIKRIFNIGKKKTKQKKKFEKPVNLVVTVNV